MKENVKLVITDIREGTCDICLEPVIGYEAKIDKFSAFVCAECMGKQFARRKEISAEQLVRKEKNSASRS